MFVGLPRTPEAQLTSTLVQHMSPAAIIAILDDTDAPVGAKDLVAMAALLKLSSQSGRMSRTWGLVRSMCISTLERRLEDDTHTPALRRLAICVNVVISHQCTQQTSLWRLAILTLTDWADNIALHRDGFKSELKFKIGTMTSQLDGTVHSPTIRLIQAELATSPDGSESP